MIIRAHSNLGEDHIRQVTEQITKYNVGGLCFFQGGPVRQALLTNRYQQLAQTPLMICIDGEWGLNMRLDSCIGFPRNMMMGAVPDAQLIYQAGKLIGEQCKRLGIHVDYAPVVDVNNNPNNPVINERSFGQDKYRVALMGTQYMKGMQSVGVMACAKHFPGHGDVAVDSHYDLPVISKTMEQLDSLELYPFRQMIREGVGSMMIAHLSIPAIDSTKNLPTSLSYNNVTGLLRRKLGYNGLTFTDALEMQGVKKYYAEEASVLSLIAGNDMLCLPGNVPVSIEKIQAAIQSGRLSQAQVDSSVKRVLLAKYNLGLNKPQWVDTTNLVNDINRSVSDLKQAIASQALTLLRLDNRDLLPLKKKNVVYVGIGIDSASVFGRELAAAFLVEKSFFFPAKSDTALLQSIVAAATGKQVIVGMHAYSRYPKNNFNLSKNSLELVNRLAQDPNTLLFDFGNPYAIANFCEARNLVACYDDDSLTHKAAIALLKGFIPATGKLTVTVCPAYPYGSGITENPALPVTRKKINEEKLLKADSLARNAIAKGAMPGSVILAAKNGEVYYLKAFGNTDQEAGIPVTPDLLYDLASVTKTTATTLAIMKLYDEGKLDPDDKIGVYLPWVKGTDKAHIPIKKLLLHEAGFTAWIPFYKETLDATGKPSAQLYRTAYSDSFPTQVAADLYLRKDWTDTLYSRIAHSKLQTPGKYVYSDLDFIILGKIVEQVTARRLDDYLQETFYRPLGMVHTNFLPLQHVALDEIAPTENDTAFRQQEVRGFVHDQAAAMFGGVSGHAGLFSTAYDVALLYQMLLNGGKLNQVSYLKKSTIKYFTSYNSKVSRRGLGFDKPEKDNQKLSKPYPAKNISSKAFGHTGFTGTCVWADPDNKTLYIFLSNRVNPSAANNKINQLNVRGDIQDVLSE